MSTLAYAALTATREDAPKGTSTDSTKADAQEPAAGKPGVTTWVDAAAALVPAEVLGVHAVLIQQVTETTKDPATGKTIVTITSAGNAQLLFWVMLVLAAVVYFFGHRAHWDNLDFLRILIPPGAFFLWCVLQSGTAFDGVAIWSEFARYLVGIVGVIVLGGVAKWLAYKADQEEPT